MRPLCVCSTGHTVFFTSGLETCVLDSGSQSRTWLGHQEHVTSGSRELRETGRGTRGPLCPFKSVPHEKALPHYLASQWLIHTEETGAHHALQTGAGSVRQSISSVAQACPTLCDPMNRSTPGLPVHHQLPKLTQTHVHWVGDAIHPSHPLSSPSSALNLSQYQGLFKWVSSSHQVAKVLEFQLQHQSFQWTPRTDLL